MPQEENLTATPRGRTRPLHRKVQSFRHPSGREDSRHRVGEWRSYTHRSFPKLGVIPPIMENQMEKKMENDMETGFI